MNRRPRGTSSAALFGGAAPFAFASRVLLALAALTASATSACRSHPTAAESDAASTFATTSLTTASTEALADAVTFDVLKSTDVCLLGHDGVLLDAGSASMRRHYGARLANPAEADVERDGATWARMRDRGLGMSFYGFDNDGSDPSSTTIDVRLRPTAARSITASVNGRSIGTVVFARDSAARAGERDAQVVSFHLAAPTLLAGVNQIDLHLTAPKATASPADIDWVHVGGGPVDPAYAAPTWEDARVSPTVGGENHAALSLRAPGFVRCGVTLPAAGHVRLYVALSGGDEAQVVVRERRDRVPSRELASIALTSEDAAHWRAVDVPLTPEGAPRLALLEIAVLHASKGARVLLGEPRVVASSTPAPTSSPSVKGVVLIVEGDLAPKSMALYGAPEGAALPALAGVAKEGATFLAHRASSSDPAGAFASMLTGLPARRVKNDLDTRLPGDAVTIADAAAQAGVARALFTANPTTGAAFGFARGWSAFASVSPLDEGPATRVYDLAAEWIEAHKDERFLVVVHARGGHPPWSATPDELKTLAPAGYTGPIEAQHAAELLARARHVPPTLHFADTDRVRAYALYRVALDAHDAALAALLTRIANVGRAGDTAILVTGDSGVDDAAHVPFGDGEGLEEASLHAPLVLAVPGSSFVQTIEASTSSADVARTVVELLGLAPPSSFGGTSLLHSLTPSAEPTGRMQLASLGDKFSLRWRDFVLAGSGEHESKLCDLSLEPSCATDVRASYGITTSLLHDAAFDSLVSPPIPAAGAAGSKTMVTAPTYFPPALDATTLAALKEWGR